MTDDETHFPARREVGSRKRFFLVAAAVLLLLAAFAWFLRKRDTARAPSQFIQLPGGGRALAFCSDGSRLFATLATNRIVVMDAKTWQRLAVLDSPGVQWIYPSGDGRRALASEYSQTRLGYVARQRFALFDVDAARLIGRWTVPQNRRPIFLDGVSENLSTVALTDSTQIGPHRVYLVDAASGREKKTLDFLPATEMARWYDGDRLLLLGGMIPTTRTASKAPPGVQSRLLRTRDWKVVFTQPSWYRTTFSKDFKTFITADTKARNVVRFYEIATGKTRVLATNLDQVGWAYQSGEALLVSGLRDEMMPNGTKTTKDVQQIRSPDGQTVRAEVFGWMEAYSRASQVFAVKADYQKREYSLFDGRDGTLLLRADSSLDAIGQSSSSDSPGMSDRSALSPDGTSFVTLDGGGLLRVWRVEKR